MRNVTLPLLLSLVVAGCADEGFDSIYVNGSVYTVDASQPWAEAFAVDGDRIIAVGTNEEVMAGRGKSTTVVDLGGKFVLPGLIEDHVHPDMIVENRMNVEITESMSYDDFTHAVQNYLAENPDATWVFGGMLNWLQDEGKNIVGWPQPSHHSILDAIVDDRPAFFWDVGGHAALVNSRAMEIYGISPDGSPPEGGSWDKDPDGNLTGVIRETAANKVWEEFLKERPAPDVQAKRGFIPVIQDLNQFGFTSMTDVWARPWNIDTYKVLEDSGQLNIRVTAYLTDPIDWVSPWMRELSENAIAKAGSHDSEMIDIIGVKFVMDGSAAGQTAMMIDPFVGTDNRGFWRNDPSYFKKKIVEYDKMGLTVRAHAVGDLAIRTVLDGIELTRNNGSELRHSVSHTVFVNPEDIDRFKSLDVVAELSPYFWKDGPHIETIKGDVGDDRVQWVFPIAQLSDLGVALSAGSDWPVSAPDVWGAIESMITRLPPGGDGTPINANAAVNLETAIHIFTMGGAYAQYKEDEIGSISVGKYADFIVLDNNLFEADVTDIHRTKVLSTVLAGDEVYRATE